MRPAGEAEVLARAKARLDRLDLYPEPVDMSGVRIHVAPWLFRVPGFRRFGGYAIARRILVKRAPLDEDLIVHELCHLWQEQHEPLRMWLSYARPSTFSRDRTRLPGQPLRARGPRGGRLHSFRFRRGPPGSGGPMTTTSATIPQLEVPGPVEPDQPMPNPPGSPETPEPGAPEVPSPDPKGPEIPDSPPSPEPEMPAEPLGA